MSLTTVEIEAFSGPALVEIVGSDEPSVVHIESSEQPEIVYINEGPASPNAVIDTTFSNGTANLTVNSESFNLAPTGTNAVGRLRWNDADGTLDLGLKGGNVTLQIGQEQVVRVVNKSNATLNEADFRAVRVRSVAEGGAQGQRLAVVLAQADSDSHSATTIGIVTETILNNEEGFITTSGNVSGIRTKTNRGWAGAETWSDGQILYLSPTHAGYLTNIKPTAPSHTIIIGWVVYAHDVNGKIFVKIDNGYELEELHNVAISGIAIGDILRCTNTTSNGGQWANVPLEDVAVTLTGSQSISGNKTFSDNTIFNSIQHSSYQWLISNTGQATFSDRVTISSSSGRLYFNGSYLTISAGSSRGWELPTASGTIALTSGPQVFTDAQTFSGTVEASNVSIKLTALPTYANEAAAVTAGLASGRVYKTSTGELRIKL